MCPALPVLVPGLIRTCVQVADVVHYGVECSNRQRNDVVFRIGHVIEDEETAGNYGRPTWPETRLRTVADRVRIAPHKYTGPVSGNAIPSVDV